jgi:glucose/arabinose dehydrogenase
MMRPVRPILALAAAAVLVGACGSDQREPGGSSFPRPSPAGTVTTLPGAPGTTAEGSTPSSPASGPTAGAPDLAAVRLQLTQVADLEDPVALTTRAGQAELYVAEQPGRVVAVPEAGGEPRVILDMTDRTRASGERGLLGLAFSPEGDRLYVSYTNNDGDSRVDEYALAADGTAVAASRREVLALDQPYPNHNGGHIVFGPDGLLYVGFGDGGSAGDPDRNGQDPQTWLGKLLRIDPRPSGGRPYSVPADNPYADGAQALPEIWSAGLRNPWGFSFDPATADLWIGDVGQSAMEEIDMVPAAQGAGRGTSFGWSAYEGSRRYNDDQDAPDSWMPLYEYEHGAAGCSVSGGVVYRGTAIPALVGAYLYGDYCASGVMAIVAADGALVDVRPVAEDPPQVVGFGTGTTGEVYVLSLGGGVYRLDPA